MQNGKDDNLHDFFSTRDERLANLVTHKAKKQPTVVSNLGWVRILIVLWLWIAFVALPAELWINRAYDDSNMLIESAIVREGLHRVNVYDVANGERTLIESCLLVDRPLMGLVPDKTTCENASVYRAMNAQRGQYP